MGNFTAIDLSKLPAPKVIEELSFEEIAKVMQIPLNTALSHARRGLAELRKSLVNKP